MNARRLPARGSTPTGLRRNPAADPEITVERLILNLPTRIRKHPGYNETVLKQTAEKTLARLASCSRPDHGQGDIADQIANSVVETLAPQCTESPVGAAPGSGLSVGFIFEGIALYLLRAFAELIARRMLAWAWNKMAGG